VANVRQKNLWVLEILRLFLNVFKMADLTPNFVFVNQNLFDNFLRKFFLTFFDSQTYYVTMPLPRRHKNFTVL